MNMISNAVWEGAMAVKYWNLNIYSQLTQVTKVKPSSLYEVHPIYKSSLGEQNIVLLYGVLLEDGRAVEVLHLLASFLVEVC